jgi:hypothetical protein
MFLHPVAWWRIIALIVAGVSFGALSPSVPTAAAAKQCVVAGTGRPLEEIWRPNMVSTISYAHRRTGDIALALRTDHRSHG